MLFLQKTLETIVRGDVDLAFRRWVAPRVKVGTRLHTSVGLVEVTEVAEVRADEIGERDARRAGFESVPELLDMLGNDPRRAIFRIGVRYAGADPRIALRRTSELSGAERGALLTKLARMDAAAATPWTHATLELIARRPATLAATLAVEMGEETARFKARVRRLKALGLTESLEVGYRLSPRGLALRASAMFEAGSRK